MVIFFCNGYLFNLLGMDNILMFFAVFTANIGYIISICNQSEAYQCLFKAQQEMDEATQDQERLSQLCSSYTTNPGVSECVHQYTRTCDAGVKEAYRIQASSLLKKLSDTCSYLEMQFAHEKSNVKSVQCDNQALLLCHTAINKIFESHGWQGTQQKSLAQLFDYINPTMSALFDQQNVCRNIENLDFASLEDCVNRTGCGNDSVVEYGSIITVLKLLDLTEGICQPGCDRIESRLENATSCFQLKFTLLKYLDGSLEHYQEKPTCSEVDATLRCVRNEIGYCEAGRDYLLLKLQIASIDINVSHNCPGVDLSLTIARGSASKLSHQQRSIWTLFISIQLTLIYLSIHYRKVLYNEL